MAYIPKKAKRIANIKKQRQKYPDLTHKIIEISDIILEVLDARFIQETRNTELEEKAKESNKKIIYVLNKADLVTIKKIKPELLKSVKPYVFVSSKKRSGGKILRALIKKEARKIDKETTRILKQEKIMEIKGKRQVLIGVIGYPNTGKSSLINFLIGRSSAGVGSDAGFTRNMQKLKLAPDIFLIDTPGVIPSEIYSNTNQEAISYHTKVGSRSYSQVKDPEIIVSNLMKDCPGVLEKFYKIDANGNSEVLLEEIGKQKNFYKQKAEINFDKSARQVLKDWQEGKIKFN